MDRPSNLSLTYIPHPNLDAFARVTELVDVLALEATTPYLPPEERSTPREAVTRG